MGEWSDAYRTLEKIYNLINRTKKNIKLYLQDFFTNMGKIFWKSENYLFHAYALLNLQKIWKGNISKSFEEKTQLNAEFVLSVLSVPLTNSLSNFERLSTSY